MTELEKNLDIISKIKTVLNKHSALLCNLTLSGSDLYGFRSSDSDYDYRGTFVLKTSKLLGLSKPREVIEIQLGEADIVLFEVKKEIALALKGNCNVLEHLSAKQIYATPEFLQLREMLLASYGKDGLYNSYKGLASFNYKKFILSGRRNTVKKYLYVFRGLMSGIYALETNKIEPNLEKLNKHFKIPEVKELIKIKVSGKEDAELPSHLDKGRIEEKILKLFDRLSKAYTKNSLPNEPLKEDVERIERWLINLRKKHFE